jgi:hypothetical protein
MPACLAGLLIHNGLKFKQLTCQRLCGVVPNGAIGKRKQFYQEATGVFAKPAGEPSEVLNFGQNRP